ncbi:lysophospholipase [Streptomyces sp. NPDC102274]|uniref:lysophospholipase n=1 Tax=Streptomyces sp. NPDC102274 TaxID=3366151 RepID=UPI0037F67997
MTDLFGPAVAARSTAVGWQPPAGIAPRGTLLILPGRGEHPLVYERFGRRLSADGYVVHALGTTPEDGTDEVLAHAAGVAGPGPVAPVVLVGSDTGALQALHAAAATDPRLPVGGIVVAGAAPTGDVARPATGDVARPQSGRVAEPPAGGAAEPPAGAVAGPPAGTAGTAGTAGASAWETELAARTACPTHRKRLSEDQGFVRGQLTAPVPAHLLAEARPDIPALILHGGADPVTPPEHARDRAAGLPRAILSVLREGLHDVLNDASHRTTAAAVVLWLERLRADPGLRPILTVETGDL